MSTPDLTIKFEPGDVVVFVGTTPSVCYRPGSKHVVLKVYTDKPFAKIGQFGHYRVRTRCLKTGDEDGWCQEYFEIDREWLVTKLMDEVLGE